MRQRRSRRHARTTSPEIRAAILCLHNQIRAENDLPALRENKKLRKAALGHSRDMVKDSYFEHTTPEGVTMVDRILRAKYVREDQGWELGENLAWGTGSSARRAASSTAWMDSPGHRANILNAGFREMGVGIVARRAGLGRARAPTYTNDFGVAAEPAVRA